MSKITANNVRDLFILDIETGLLYWKDVKIRAEKGDCVGFVSYSNGKPYLKVSYKSEKYYVHRLVWLYLHGEWAKELDHKDRNTLNNRPDNLRQVTHTQNLANFERRSHGVHKHGTKFRAEITIQGLKKRLGSFDTREEAEAAYKKAHIELYGENSIYKQA